MEININDIIKDSEMIIKTRRKDFIFPVEFDYTDFEKLFIIYSKKYTVDYILDDEIKYILHQIYNYFKGDPFYKKDPVTKKYILASDKDRQKGLYIAGPTGTGKSTFCKILFCVIKALNIKYIYDNITYNYSALLTSETELQKEYQTKGDTELQKRCSLYIDDIGQYKEVSYMGNKIDVLKEIIIYRYDILTNSFTFYTSNYPINSDKLIEMYGERVADRLLASCNYYTITGTNYRRK